MHCKHYHGRCFPSQIESINNRGKKRSMSKILEITTKEIILHLSLHVLIAKKKKYIHQRVIGGDLMQDVTSAINQDTLKKYTSLIKNKQRLRLLRITQKANNYLQCHILHLTIVLPKFDSLMVVVQTMPCDLCMVDISSKNSTKLLFSMSELSMEYILQ